MTKHSICFLALFLTLSAIGTPNAIGQDQALNEEAEALIRARYEAWNSGDQEAIVQNAGFTIGFGFRTLAPRGTEVVSPQRLAQAVRMFFESMEYYRLKLDELHTTVHGDVVVAWGFHTEDFKARGRNPEKVRVRFSLTMKKSQDGFDTLLSHRDIQRFDAEGRYIPREAGR